jgi:hypothetical protein
LAHYEKKVPVKATLDIKMSEEASTSANRRSRDPKTLLDILMEPVYQADRQFQANQKQLVQDYIERRRKMLEFIISLAFGTCYTEIVAKLVESHLEDPEKYVSVESWPQESVIGVLTSGLVEFHPTDDTKLRIKTKATKFIEK